MFKLLAEKLGPGLLYAAVAVGVSHLVSSTIAGASYGLVMVGYMIAVCLIKYPTFLFGARYTAATGETLVEGYTRMGRWVVVLFFFMQLFEYTFAISGSAVTTAALLRSILGLEVGIGLELVLLLSSALIIGLGRYAVLEDLTRLLVIVFSVGTVIAAITALSGIDPGTKPLTAELKLDTPTILFLIAVAGWMPTGTAGSVGLSLWVKAKSIRLQRPVSIREASFDFNLGYGTAIFLAICFVALGTYVLFINGIAVETHGAAFATQLIMLFTSSIGDWVYPLIAIAALTVMYSTLLTLADLMPRSSAAALLEIFPVPKLQSQQRFNRLFGVFIVVEVLAVSAVVVLLLEDFGTFIRWITSMGFVVAPLFSYLNHRAMFGSHVKPEDQPGRVLRYWSIATVVILSATGVGFLYMTYFM